MSLQNVVSPSFAIDSGNVNPAANAFDASLATNWATSVLSNEGISGVCWIGQNFGSGNAKNIVQMTIKQLSANTAISSVIAQWSDNGSSWTSAGTFSISKDNAINTFTVAAAAHQYWRLLANGNPGGSERWQVEEVTMSIPDAAPPPPPPATLPGPPSGQWFGPAFSAYGTNNVQPLSANVQTKVALNHAVYDPDAELDLQNSRFVCRLAGVRHVDLSVCFAGSISAGVSQQVSLYLNGSQYNQVVPPQSGPGNIGFAVDLFLNVGDVLELYAYVSSGSGLSITGQSSWLNAHYVRPCATCGQT